MRRIKIFWQVVKDCRLDKAFIGFVILFFAGSLVLLIREPDIHTYGEAMWVFFVASTTIGYGDYTVVSHIGRILVVVATIYQLILTALLTGVIIGHYQEIMEYRKKEVVKNFFYKMEHLTELSREELEEIQNNVRKLR